MYPNNFIGVEGFIARDIEERHTNDGKLIKKFCIFISEGRDEKRQSAPLDVTLWEKTAERFDGVKGDRVLVQGRVKPEQWQDKTTGKDRYKVSITGELAMVTWKKQQTDMQMEQTKDWVAEKGSAEPSDDLPFMP